jgi:hypothetical protein
VGGVVRRRVRCLGGFGLGVCAFWMLMISIFIIMVDKKIEEIEKTIGEGGKKF